MSDCLLARFQMANFRNKKLPVDVMIKYRAILKNYLISFFFLILALVFYIPYYKKFKANIRLINGKDNEQFIYYSSLKIKNNLELFLILFYVLIYIIFNILLFIYLRVIHLDFKFLIIFGSF